MTTPFDTGAARTLAIVASQTPTAGHTADRAALITTILDACAEVERLQALEAVATAHHDVCFGLCGCRVCAWVKASRKEPAR